MRIFQRTWITSGYVVVEVTYRFSGEAKFPAAIEDIKASVRWLRSDAVTKRASEF